MIKNYFKAAWRNLTHNKVFAAINITGLALGLTCSLLIMLWIQDEYSIDAFHKNKHQLYYVYERSFADGKVQAGYNTQGLLAEELKANISQIEHASAVEVAGGVVFEGNDKILKRNGLFAGSDFFTIFSYPLLQGTPQALLNGTVSIAISRRMAEEFFGSISHVIGKTIRFADKEDLTITGVFENVPDNSSFQFDFVRSWEAFISQNAWAKSWGNSDPFTIVQLRTDANRTKVEANIRDFVHRYLPNTNGPRIELGIQPYHEKYLHETFVNGLPDGGRIEYVRLFSIVAIIILLIACINFMNLSTARSIRRSKEIGVRKVLGAARSRLIAQFSGEALLLTFFAIVIAVLLTALLLPAFNWLSGKQLIFPLGRPIFWFYLLCLLIVTSLIAGSYPALFLSSLKPVQVLKSKLKFGRASIFFRKGLVVFQFTLSIILIIGMIVIYRQVNYVQTKNLGFDRDNLIYIPIEGELTEKYNLFKEKAISLPGILAVSRMRQTPTGYDHHKGGISWLGKNPDDKDPIADVIVGYDFVKTLHLKLKEGRDFSTDYRTDSMNFLVNESMVAKMGYQDPDPIGKKLIWENEEGTIVGVLNDFHFYSMHKAIDPMVIRLNEKQKYGTVLLRVEAGKTKDALAALQKLSKVINPKIPFNYQFADEQYAKLYSNEQLVSKLANCFAAIAIFISCLGLFALATFTAEQRLKEIGVRKVLGASVLNILAMLTGNFLKPVAIAILIAVPVSQYIMQRWLQDFAYKIDIEWWMFAQAGILAIFIAIITVSFQGIKAAIANPVKSLRTE
ncbi:MAG TPA: ABC transporter permease [Chitinophagaceae bacterium]|nr:ABC transporter permease [Chitinophagaceae bacterium]